MFSACFGSSIKDRGILMCSALILIQGLKNQLYSCAARSFRFMD